MIKVQNTLSGKKEVLKTKRGSILELFVCGPTVYDYSHLGHARTYIAFDVMVKYLREKGYDVFYLQNITDIDDKIIQRAKEKKISPRKLAGQFEREYKKNMKELKVNSVTKYARATDHIKEIISQVERLKKKGFAYQIEDGIYYNIKKFKNYGKLSGRTTLQAEDAVSRIDESKGKRNKGDFALWKFSKPGEPSWPSPFGKGRPGWHIEDTAIAEKFFGFRYDIHGGGMDLAFPHHEAEIAQMEAVSGKKPMVKYWLHTGFLTVKGKKMSKSLGNFVTIEDFLKKSSPRTLRFLVAKNHYRSRLDYSDSSVIQAERELERIDEFTEKLKSKKYGQGPARLKIPQKEFEKAMEDDFNTPRAVAAVFELVKNGNSLIDQDLLSQKDRNNALEFLKTADRIFNVFFRPAKNKIPGEVLKLAKKREKLRMQKKWAEADEARAAIEKLGWKVEDTESGPKLKNLQ
jgi:cysteinyl-tRNA synthetase